MRRKNCCTAFVLESSDCSLSRTATRLGWLIARNARRDSRKRSFFIRFPTTPRTLDKSHDSHNSLVYRPVSGASVPVSTRPA